MEDSSLTLEYCENRMSILSYLTRLARDENGTTALEYGLILGMVSIVIILAAANLANGSGILWTKTTDALNNN